MAKQIKEETENINSKNYRGRRSQSRNKNKFKSKDRNRSDCNDAISHDGSKGNDPAWYMTLPELASAAARFPFSRPLGTKVTLETQDWAMHFLDEFNEGHVPNSIPGIMTIHWAPTVGSSTNPISPLNVTSREIYSFVRHANSGASNYDATDLMLYLLAMDSIYSVYTAGVRAYGLIMMYTKVNRYMPASLIEALGFDFDDLKANAAEMRWALNQIAYKMSSFAVPNFMSYYLRHMWMNSGVYTDKDSAKAQMYAFVQDGYYVYDDEIESTTFAGLKYEKLPANMTIQTYLDTLNKMINPLLASEDMGIMSGDILKAFGPNNLFTIPPIPIDYVVVPTYSPEVLTQITNLSIVGKMDGEKYGNIYSVHPEIYFTSNIVQCIDGTNLEGYLYSNPVFELVDPGEGDKEGLAFVPLVDKVITADPEVPSESDVLVMTRLTNTPTYSIKPKGDNTYYYAFDQDHTCGSEVVSEVKYHFMVNGLYTSESIGTLGFVVDEQGGAPITSNRLSVIAAYSKFDWAPTIPLVHRPNEGDAQYLGWIQDTNNYTVMTPKDLNKLHEVALQSEFYVPAIASATRKPN